MIFAGGGAVETKIDCRGKKMVIIKGDWSIKCALDTCRWGYKSGKNVEYSYRWMG